MSTMAWQLKKIFGVVVLLSLGIVDVRGDDCTTNPDCNGGVCDVVANPNTCTCPENKYGTTCDNTQVCTSSGSECLNGGTCNEDSEAHVCDCTGIYSGTTCQDKCDTDANCGTGGTCGGTPKVCTCPETNYGDRCTNTQVCTSSGSECLNGGTCNEDSEAHVCDCTGIYSGTTCQDKCDTDANCGTGGTCGGTPKVCTCPETKYGDRCTNTQVCTTNADCLNEGTCNTEHMCTCGAYKGDTCQHACDTDADCNGGTCTSDDPKTCTCTGGRGGGQCEKDPICTDGGNECKNGGTCMTTMSPYSCNCTMGYTGDTCEKSSAAAVKIGLFVPFAMSLLISLRYL